MKKPFNFAKTLTKLPRFLAVIAIAGVLNASLIVQATASPAPQKAIDDWTDNFFYRLHPELGRRKINSDETGYINEWAAIEGVVRNSLVYADNSCGDPANFEWMLSHYDYQGRNGLVSPVLDLVADAVFYRRHPELSDRKIQPGETDFASEWLQIRRKVSELHPCD